MSNVLSCAAGHQWPASEGTRSATSGRGLACPVCGSVPTLESLGAPPETATALAKLRDDLGRAAGKNLAGLILYGGLARGRYHPGKSDINLVILLRDTSGLTLEALAPLLRNVWRALQVEPLILMPDEVRGAANDFPTKFLDIKSHHLVLLGEDPFAELDITHEQLRARIAQALRNLSLRLRRRYLALAHDPAAAALMLGNMARALAIELAGLLRLTGREVPPEDRTVTIFDAAASAFHLDREALLQLAELRRDGRPATDVSDLFSRVEATLAQLMHTVHNLQEERR